MTNGISCPGFCAVKKTANKTTPPPPPPHIKTTRTCEILDDNLVRLRIVGVCRHSRLRVVLQSHRVHPLPSCPGLSLSLHAEEIGAGSWARG